MSETEALTPPFDDLDLEPLAQIIPQTLHQLEQKIIQSKQSLEHLYSVTVPYSELSKDFSIDRSVVDRSLNEIRNANQDKARKIAESELIRVQQSEELVRRQADRIRALEIKLSAAQTSLKEQIDINDFTHDLVKKSLDTLATKEGKRIDFVKLLKTRDENKNKEIERLRTERNSFESLNGILQSQLDSLQGDKDRLNQLYVAANSEKRSLQTKFDYLVNDRDGLNKLVKDKDMQLDELHTRDRVNREGILRIEATVRELEGKLNEATNRVMQERQDFKDLRDQQEREATKRMEDQKKEIERRLKAAQRNEIATYRADISELKKRYEAGLQEALQETKKLVTERDEYYKRFKDLEAELDAHKRRLNAHLSRKVLTKCTEVIRELNTCDAVQTARSTSAANTLRPVENIAQRLLNDLEASTPSGSSTPANESQNNPH